MSHEESVYHFKRLENLEKIRHTNGLNTSSLSVENKKSVTSSIGKSSNNHKESDIRCHYCEKKNHEYQIDQKMGRM
jgi:aspartate carbamoyltransferase regulatory subunit